MSTDLIYLSPEDAQGLQRLCASEPELSKPLAERVVTLKRRKTICPSAWRKGHWSALDRQAAVLSSHGRELYEAEKSLLWRQGHPWKYVRQVLEGSILVRREKEASAAKPTETLP